MPFSVQNPACCVLTRTKAVCFKQLAKGRSGNSRSLLIEVKADPVGGFCETIRARLLQIGYN